jgi:cytochrome b
MMNAAPSKAAQPASVAVWDPAVRVSHWLLVALFAVVYVTAEEEGSTNAIHVWGGYAIGAIVVLRILWGFVGPQYARFSSFVCGPAAALRYLVELVSGRARRYLGHSPAGGAMVIALLVFLAATVATGVVAYGERGQGPLAADGAAVVSRAKAEEGSEGKKEKESLVGEAHGALANITLGLVILHVLGVGLASYAHRENLVAAMVSGRKRAAK